jgi:omega-hydroxy-beta-dihydromenaquinone-9 sulfotransferase
VNAVSAPIVSKGEKTPEKFHPYPFYSPRFWHGMRYGDWIKLAAKHRFDFSLVRWPMALAIGAVTPFNSAMRLVQNAIYGKRIAETAIEQPPVFIIGHWRSGTTFLHELMYLDDRFASPNTYQCFAPHHFLLTEWCMLKFGWWLMPRHRPMDNMEAGFDRPQEDEFALLTLGAPTPYLRMAFPNHPPPYMEFLDMQGVDPVDLERFEKALTHFVKLLTFHLGKQVLLKSPPHTGRVEVLSRMFPGAKFLHITRNPYSLYSSTVRLWKSLDDVQGLHWPPRPVGLEEYVFECLERMYGGFEKQRQGIPPGRIYDIRYEDLVKDPVAKLSEVYRELDLGDFSAVQPKIEAHVAGQKNYKTNKHELDESLKRQIRERWSLYFERYGYE